MSTDKKILVAVVLLGVCLVASVAVHVAQWGSAGKRSDFAEQFAVLNLRTNGGKGIMIVDRQTKKPIWGKWDFTTIQGVMCFLDGTNIVNVFTGKDTRQPLIEVTFYGDDSEKRAVWRRRGTFAGFNERTLFGGGAPKDEVWLNDAWHAIQLRTNAVHPQTNAILSGIMLDGKWRHLVLTNGVIAVE